MPKHLSATQAAGVLGVSTGTLSSWRTAGKGPPFKTRGLREIVYDTDELTAWCEENNVLYDLPDDTEPAVAAEG